MQDKFDFQSFDRRVISEMEEWNVPGCAVAVIKDGEAIHTNGYGYRDLESRKQVNENTVFAIGSTSKAFTAVTAAILVDRGLLEWDRPVRHYLPDFELYDDAATRRMTVRDLLSHRSGLPRHDAMWYGSSFSRWEMMDRLRYLQPSADFRAIFQYQNLMFMAAGALVEKISGQTWEIFTEQNILGPLGMKRTSLTVDALRAVRNAARPYSSGDKGHKLLDYRDLDAIAPAGGINSCLTDLVKWIGIQLGGGKYLDRRIVSSEGLSQTHAPHTTIEYSPGRILQYFPEIGPESYGLGWFTHHYRGHRLLRHGGHIDGFSTQISFMPEINAGVIVLTNLGGSSHMYLPTFLAYDLLLGMEPLDWSSRIRLHEENNHSAGKHAANWYAKQQKGKTQPSHELRAYEGTYCNPGYGEIEITREKDSLRAAFNGKEIDLVHYHYDVFDWPTSRAGSTSLKISFSTDRFGRINSLNLPLEPNVESILFTRLSDPKLREQSYLEHFTGTYSLNGTEISVCLSKDENLWMQMPGYGLLILVPIREGLFKVDGRQDWFVEFTGKKVSEFHLIQPASMVKAKLIV
jgi:CubicO group peptidase (beta-lactamase class C family)